MSKSSISDVSELDVVEGSKANAVYESQKDSSLGFSVSKNSDKKKQPKYRRPSLPDAKSPKQKIKELLEGPYKPSSLSKRNSLSYTIPRLVSFNSETFDFPKLTSSESGRAQIDIESRFYQVQREVDRRLEEQRKAKELEELKECTFQPNPSKELTRKPEEIYEDFQKYQRRSEEKLNEMRLAKTSRNNRRGKFKPTINQKSHDILQTKPYLAVQCHDRLFSMTKGNINTRQEALSNFYNFDSAIKKDLKFTPKVNRKSKEMVRDKPIEKRLYEDALRRMDRPETSVQSEENKKLLKKSTQILVKSFIKEFEEKFQEIDTYSTGMFNYMKFAALVEAMHFLSDSSQKNSENITMMIELWKIAAKENDEVPKNQIKALLMGLMGYYLSWMDDPMKQQTLIGPKTVQKLHQKYANFVKNRASVCLDKNNKNPKTLARANSYECTDKHSDHPKIEDLLLEQGKKYENRRKELQEKYRNDCMNECTFTPEILSPSSKEQLVKRISLNTLYYSSKSIGLTPEEENPSLKNRFIVKNPVRTNEDSHKEISPNKSTGSKHMSKENNFKKYSKPEEKHEVSNNKGNTDDCSEDSVKKLKSKYKETNTHNEEEKAMKPEDTVTGDEDAVEYFSSDNDDKFTSSESEVSVDMTEVEEANESEEDESFIISVNLGGNSISADLRVKTAQSPESAVSEFSKKYNLRPKEQVKLLKHVQDIIKANT